MPYDPRCCREAGLDLCLQDRNGNMHPLNLISRELPTRLNTIYLDRQLHMFKKLENGHIVGGVKNTDYFRSFFSIISRSVISKANNRF